MRMSGYDVERFCTKGVEHLTRVVYWRHTKGVRCILNGKSGPSFLAVDARGSPGGVFVVAR